MAGVSARLPARAPRRMMGRAAIGVFLAAVARGQVVLALDAEVVGAERAAFRVTATLPDGRRILEHVIVGLSGRRIARQVDVEAWN